MLLGSGWEFKMFSLVVPYGDGPAAPFPFSVLLWDFRTLAQADLCSNFQHNLLPAHFVSAVSTVNAGLVYCCTDEAVMSYSQR